MIAITTVHHLSLSVTNLAASSEWYTRVLGFGVHSEVTGVTFTRTRMRHPDADITVTLTQHDDVQVQPFDVHQVGLDHVAFQVSSLAEVQAFARRFDDLGVVHSAIAHRGEAPHRGVILAFRDPDQIQLEIMAVEDGGRDNWTDRPEPPDEETTCP